MLLEEYGSLDMYDKDMEKMFIIDHEQLQFDKNAGWSLIGISNKPDGFCMFMRHFVFMMIYFIESNQLVRIKISCLKLYEMNQMKMDIYVKYQIEM